MHNTNKEQHGGTDDVPVARPIENMKECATSLAIIENKKGSQVHKSLSTDNRDKPPSSSAIASPRKRGRKKKANNKDKHSTDSAIVPTKGRKGVVVSLDKCKGDEGSNDGDNPTSSSQVVLYASHVEECAVDTAPEETNKGRSKRLLASKDSEKEALPAKRRKMGESNMLLPSKDNEAALDKDHLMCQMSIQTIIDAAEQLKKIHELINSVRDAGFGHFIDTKIKGSINRKGMSFILKHIDIPTMTVSFSEEKKIEINCYAIHHLYGIPNGHLSAPRPNENNEVLPELKQELGFRSDEDITTRKLVDMLIVMVNEHVESKNVINRDLALKLFYLILFSKGLCIGTAPRISSKEASMVKGLDYDKIRDMDFCQLVVDELQTSAIKWQGHVVLKYKYIEGLAVAPIIMYLDSLIYKDLTLMGKDTPRVLFLDEKKLTTILKAYRNMAAQKGNEDWVFGKIINWKAKNDRFYKTISEEREEEIMVQKRKSICFAVAGRSFHALETNQTGPSELMFEETGDAKPKEMAIQDGSTIMEDPCAISVQNANDALIKDVSDEGTEEENELAPTGDNAADEQEETNVVSWHEQIKIPCFEEGDKDNTVGHYFMMAVNLKKRRFELLDSLGGEGAEQHFINTTEVFKEIWKEAYKQSEGRLSPENLDDFTYEKPRVIPLQGATLNCGVYMIMFLMFWTGKSLLHIRQDDILYIRKRLLYLILMWEPLKINIGLIESLHRDDFIKINLGDYSIIKKQTTVRPNMNVIVSLPDVNIPNLKEIDDGKENYPQEQEYVLISSQEDYIMQCLKGRVRGEDDLKKHLDGSFQPEETIKNGEEDKSQQQEKPVVVRNNEDKSMEYLRAREAKFDDLSRNLKEEGLHMIQSNPGQKRLNIVLFTPANKKYSPPGYKVEKDTYSSLTGSQGFQTPPKDLKYNTVDVQHIDNLTKRKRKVVSSSDVTSTKRPNITARKLYEPVVEYRPKKFQNQGKANKLFNYILKSNKFLDTKVFDAPAMHSVVPDMRIPLSGNEIKKQFGTGEFRDGATMDYIIDEMKTTSELYHTGERVLLSQGFIMYVLQVSIWNQSTEQIKQAAAKKDKSFDYTENFNMAIALDAFPRYVDKGKSLLDAKLMARMELVLKEVYGLDAYNAKAMQYSQRSTGSRTQEPAPAHILVYHRRSARERELADERNRAFREQEAVSGLEQLGECLVRTTIMAFPSPNAPPHIRRACRPSMPSMAELPRRVDGLHPREARNQHICAGEYPPLEHLERALEG
ncbi:hypothetical protein ACQ4PT_053242 [Festuca glaucescens]